MVSNKLKEKLVDTLLDVPATDTFEGRTTLLSGLPGNIKASLQRNSGNQLTDLDLVVTALDRLGRLVDTGERPLIMIAEKALRHVRGLETGKKLQDIIKELEKAYGGEQDFSNNETPLDVANSTQEVLIFQGRDERVKFPFIQMALEKSSSVARLQVPRLVDGKAQAPSFGTGWLVTSNIIVTNHHVIAAREVGEVYPPENVLKEQTTGTEIWFDYFMEGASRDVYKCEELLAWNEKLDYALIRINNPSKTQIQRKPLELRKDKPIFYPNYHLNIIQYPKGGSLQYAIRNNYYVGDGDDTSFIRYMTDTEAGASGSPVFNDDWQVVALHHAYRKIKPMTYKGEQIDKQNQGVLISSILNHIKQTKPQLLEEIQEVQG